MRLIISALFLIFTISTSYAANRNLIPVPREVLELNDVFLVENDLKINLNNGYSLPALEAVKRLTKGLAYRTNIPFENKVSIGSPKQDKGIIISFQNKVNAGHEANESYEITVDKSKITLFGETDIGVIRGVETLLQLIERRDSVFVIPCVKIKDSPRFPWRGLMIDVSRHFMPVDVIKRNMDAMAALKLNVLHLHLSDDQGWRLESKKYPSLHIMASGGDYYTHAQITELVNYASLKGITIIPEVDVPGHSMAILSAMPHLASKAQSLRPASTFGIKDAVLDPSKDETYTFLTNLFREVDSLFPGKYIHIGGDEVKADQWESNAKIKVFMARKQIADYSSLQNYFVLRMADSLRLLNRSIIGWEEIFDNGLAKDAIVQAWKSKNVSYQAARNGYKSIVSQGFYLDLMYPAEKHYLNEILPEDVTLTEDQQQNILGGEACMWSELVDGRTMDSRIWPRLGGIAENLWSMPDKLNNSDLPERLTNLSTALNEFHLSHQSARYAILHEIAQSENIVPLIELMNLCEPLTGYLRHSSQTYTTSTPLNAFADAVTTDNGSVIKLRKAVDEFVISGKNVENFDYISDKLYEWVGFFEYYEPYFRTNSKLVNLVPLAQKLSNAAQIADEALGFAVKGKIPKDAWVENAKAVMKDAKEPVEGVRLSIVTDLERLLSFAKDHDVIEF